MFSPIKYLFENILGFRISSLKGKYSYLTYIRLMLIPLLISLPFTLLASPPSGRTIDRLINFLAVELGLLLVVLVQFQQTSIESNRVGPSLGYRKREKLFIAYRATSLCVFLSFLGLILSFLAAIKFKKINYYIIPFNFFSEKEILALCRYTQTLILLFFYSTIFSNIISFFDIIKNLNSLFIPINMNLENSDSTRENEELEVKPSGL